MSKLSRRVLLAIALTSGASAALSACTSDRVRGNSAYIPARTLQPVDPQLGADPRSFGDPQLIYAASFDEGYDIPAVPINEIDPKYYRQVVPDPTGERPGTVVVIRRTITFILSSMAARRSATVSASAARALNGRGAA